MLKNRNWKRIYPLTKKRGCHICKAQVSGQKDKNNFAVIHLKGINCQCGTVAEAVYFMQGMLFLLLADFRNRKISKNRELIGLNSFHFIYMCVWLFR